MNGDRDDVPGQLADLEGRFLVERERNAQLQRLLHEAGEAYRQLDRGVAQLELRLLNDLEVIERTTAELAAMRVSRSWRLTAPLRALVGRLRARRGRH